SALSVASTSPTDIRLTWHPPSSQQSRGALTRYRVDYGAVVSVEVRGNETSFTLRGLQPNQMYRLRIAAGTGVGFGIPSEWVQHQTLALIFAPTELKVRPRENMINVTWQPSPNHALISGYKLSYQEAEADESFDGKRSQYAHTIRLRKKARHHLLTGLAPDRQYEVRVWAFNKQVDGAAAVWKGRTDKATKLPPTVGHPPPIPPSTIQATSNSSTSIWLRWEKPRFSNIRIINYTVRCSPSGTTNASLVTYHTSRKAQTSLSPLSPSGPSTPPEELQLSTLDPSSVLVSWRPPLEPNGIIVSYRILYSIKLSEPEHLWKNLSEDGGVRSVAVRGLSSGTRYFFKLGASTEVGPGPFSPVKDVQTPLPKYGVSRDFILHLSTQTKHTFI
uniref:Immunoglobulin superfamily DCC subclass member 4 n=1 Tax=Nothobranchius furzeri TaxID=105023 RepID=A0A8C6KTB6_NOTFU